MQSLTIIFNFFYQKGLLGCFEIWPFLPKILYFTIIYRPILEKILTTTNLLLKEKVDLTSFGEIEKCLIFNFPSNYTALSIILIADNEFVKNE